MYVFLTLRMFNLHFKYVFNSNTHALLNSRIFMCLIFGFYIWRKFATKENFLIYGVHIYTQISSYDSIVAVKRYYESSRRTYLEDQDGKEDFVKNQAKRRNKYRVHVNGIHAMQQLVFLFFTCRLLRRDRQ